MTRSPGLPNQTMAAPRALPDTTFGPVHPTSRHADHANDASVAMPILHSSTLSEVRAEQSHGELHGIRGVPVCTSEAIRPDDADEDGRCPEISTRGAVSMVTFDTAVPSPGPSTPAERKTRAARAQDAATAKEPQRALLTECSLTERANKMFVIGNTEPVASGMGIAAAAPTKRVVRLAWQVANAMYDEHGEALKRSFGNFDRVVALGWLLGDVIGGGALDWILSRADAFALGGGEGAGGDRATRRRRGRPGTPARASRP